MNSHYTELFRFQSVSMPEDLFHVMRFRGTEGLNTLFTFTIDLVSNKVDVDTTAMLRNSGVFTINRKDGSKAVFSGYPSEVTQSGHFNGYTYYSVVLRPTFWKLCGVVQSRIFLNKNAKDTVTELLQEQPYFSFSHEFRLGQTAYPVPEFAMQYEESVYDYICWRLEEQGIAWHIEQSGNSDKLVFSDTPHLYGALPQTPALRYSPPSGMQVNRDEELITAFNLSSHPLPKQVVIRTYNWQAPNKAVTGKAQISAEGLGDVYLTTEAVENDAEAGRLAAIRAEELRCRGRLFSGTSAVPAMRPGFVFALEGHYNPAFNREYFLTEVTHEGSQEAFLSLGLGIPLHDAKEHFFYHNTFVCIESDVQYRPPRKAPRTAVHGVVHAFIDGAGSGARPELDAFGRYKVLFPFDISGRQKGNASCWLRMAQPQVGNNSGLSFPLLPGTEVTVAFQDGNPDRPVITGALSNGETGSLTRNANVNTTGMRTAGGNQIVFNDEDTKQAIHLRTPSGRGLSMSAGSLDSASMTTDAWLKAASTMSADISGLGHTFFGGFKNSQFVSNDDKHAMLSGIATMGTSMVSSLFNTLATTEENEGYSYGADVAKILNLALQAGINFHDVGDSHKHTYSSIVRATKEDTLSEIKVQPKQSQLVAGIVLSVTAQATKLAVEAANAGLANDSDDPHSWDSKESDYYESRKTAAIHDILTSSAADLVPEILTYVLMSKLLSGSDPTGGVLQEALENNISLVAKGPVGIHTPSGILLNTAFTQHHVRAGENPACIKTTDTHKTGSLSELENFLKCAEPPTSTSAQLTYSHGNAVNWGTNGNALKQQRAFNDLMQDQDELKYTSPATPNNPTARGKTYVALLTELLFEYATYRKSITEEVHSQQAKTHWLSTLDGASSITLRTEESGKIKPGLAIQVAMEKSGDKHEIFQVLKTADNPKATRSFRLSNDGFTLNAKKDKATSTLFGDDGNLTLTTEEGADVAAITLGKAGITLTVKKKGIELNEKGASIAKDGEVDVAGVHFKKNQVTAAGGGGKLVLGGEVEIINTGSSFKVDDLNKQVTDLLKKVDDNRADLDKTIEDLRKLEETPPVIPVSSTGSTPSAPGAPSVAAVTPTP